MSDHRLRHDSYLQSTSLITVRASSTTFVGVTNVLAYTDPTGAAIGFWFQAPSDAGNHVGLLCMNFRYSGLGTAAQRSVIFNRSRSDA